MSSRHRQINLPVTESEIIYIKKKGRYAPIVHIHLQDDVRYGDLGSFIQTGEDVKQTFALVPTEITTGTNL